MKKINFENLPSTATPINAENLNAIQNNAEEEINSNLSKINTVMANSVTFKDVGTVEANQIDDIPKLLGDLFVSGKVYAIKCRPGTVSNQPFGGSHYIIIGWHLLGGSGLGYGTQLAMSFSGTLIRIRNCSNNWNSWKDFTLK